MNLQLNITTKLTLLFVLFAALLLGGIGSLAYERGRAALEAATVSSMLSTAIEKEAALNAWVEDGQWAITALAHSPELLDDVNVLVTATPGSAEAQAAHERLRRALQTWAGPGRQYLNLLIIDAETGRVIVATAPEEEGKFKEDRPYFVNGKNAPYVQNAYYQLGSQQPVMTAAAPFRSVEGQLLAVLAGQLNLSEMNTIIQRRSGLHQTDDAFLVNTSNLFVTQPRFFTDPAVLWRGIHSEPARRCLARTSGMLFAEDYRGVPVIAAYRWLSERQLCLIVKLDQAEALAPAHAFGRTILLIGVLVLLVASVLAVGLARTITQPVLALQQGAVRLGRGELDTRLPETSGDELGRLARQFNTMAAALAEKEAQLRHYTEGLESLVQERTASLQQSEERTRLIIESALDAVITIDTDSKITGWNTQAEFAFGWSRQEALAQSLDIILPPQYQQAHHRGMKHFLATGEGPVLNQRFEITARRRDGVEFPIELTISPVQMDNDFIFSAFIRDITERKRAEEQFKLVVEASPNAIVLVNTEGKISLVNVRVETLFGYKREELWGQPIEMLVPSQFHAHHDDGQDDFFSMVTVRRMNVGQTLCGLRKDSSQVPIEIDLSPITTTEGDFVLVSIVDITERKQAEEEIAESLRREQLARVEAEAAQERLAFLVDASNTLSSSLDYYTTLTAVAQLAVPRIADWSAIDVIEPEGLLRRVAVVHADPSKVVLAYELQRRYPPDPDAPRGVYHVLRTGQPEFYPEIPEALLEAAFVDEEQRNLIHDLGLKSAVVVPIMTHNRILGVITFVMAESGRRYSEVDLAFIEELASRAALAVDNAWLYHETKKLNEKLEQRVIERTAQLEAANRELEAFAYSVSHDLRAPLRSIDGFGQALLEDYHDSLEAEAQHYLQRVRAASQRMAELIDDLLTLSRLTRSEMHLEMVDLSDLAWVIAAELARFDPDRKVEFVVAPDVVVRADTQLMRAALENLLGNAWKFTAKHPRARIEFGVLPHPDGQPAYFVRDDGAGFDMAYADKLFGAFQRLHTPAEFSGTGIGLATVQRIIHRHGGQVWAEGAVGRGATFYFTLGSYAHLEK